MKRHPSPAARAFVRELVRDFRSDGVAASEATRRAWRAARDRGYRTR